jgi:hypothetical protein
VRKVLGESFLRFFARVPTGHRRQDARNRARFRARRAARLGHRQGDDAIVGLGDGR